MANSIKWLSDDDQCCRFWADIRRQKSGNKTRIWDRIFSICNFENKLIQIFSGILVKHICTISELIISLNEIIELCGICSERQEQEQELWSIYQSFNNHEAISSSCLSLVIGDFKCRPRQDFIKIMYFTQVNNSLSILTRCQKSLTSTSQHPILIYLFMLFRPIFFILISFHKINSHKYDSQKAIRSQDMNRTVLQVGKCGLIWGNMGWHVTLLFCDFQILNYQVRSISHNNIVFMFDIFSSTENWSFSEKEEQALLKLKDIQKECISSLPSDMYTQKSITLFDELRKFKLYDILKFIPKGSLHHLHFDCTEDEQFYAQHVVNDPIVYLNKDQNGFCLGTKEEAEKNGWVTMENVRKQFQSEQDFIKKISNLTMLNKEDMLEFSEHQAARWEIFQTKICNFFPILAAEHLFRKYVIHCLRKYVKNGYDRIEYRSLLTKLTEYDENGNIVKVHHEKRFMDVVDQAMQVVQAEFPQLTVGFIFFGLKVLPAEENQKILTTVLEQKWHRTIGIDFVQQEDPYGDQAPYDEVANKVLAKFPDMDIKKVYHVGQTKDHQNNNIQIAINAGTARIGHGINVFQHPHLLYICKDKKICFEKCPISNILLTYCKDPRQGTSPLVQGLGIPLTINPDDPGKFGYEDSTMDYFFAFVSYNWSLKNLKLLGYHSINHSICTSETKQKLLESFNNRWDQWIDDFMTKNQ